MLSHVRFLSNYILKNLVNVIKHKQRSRIKALVGVRFQQISERLNTGGQLFMKQRTILSIQVERPISEEGVPVPREYL